MSLNISINKSMGIDAAALKDVTKQIFERANSQNNSVLENADLTKFNRVSLGTSLYNVSANQASQIAIANSGFNVNLSNKAVQSLQYLNNLASKSIFNVADGNIVLAEVQTTEKKENLVNLPTFGKLVENSNSTFDKKEGSNPFFNSTSSKASSEKEDEINVNIFA